MSDLPAGLPRTRTASLNRVKSEEHLAAFVDDGGRVARIVVARARRPGRPSGMAATGAVRPAV